MANQRRSYRDELEEVLERGRGLIEELTPEQTTWRPAPDRWSVAECLEHLAKTAEAYLPGVERAVERAEAAGGEPPAGPERLGVIERWFIRAMEPPPRRRFPAPRRVRPDLGETPDPDAAATTFLDRHRRVVELAGRADAVDPRGARVRSPFFPLLSFSLGGALRNVAAHARRHLWQAEQVRVDPGFPASDRPPAS